MQGGLMTALSSLWSAGSNHSGLCLCREQQGFKYLFFEAEEPAFSAEGLQAFLSETVWLNGERWSAEWSGKQAIRIVHFLFLFLFFGPVMQH